jgi:hypothetical protein
LPCILLNASISEYLRAFEDKNSPRILAINSTILCWFSHPELDYLRPTATILLHLSYPVNFSLNVLTTSLIAYAILRQHFESVEAGMSFASGFSLVYVVRVVVESALIYTLQMLVLLILYELKHPSIIIFQTTCMPSIGALF